MNNQQLQTINVFQLSDKCKSKKELYHFLTQDCGAYLPRLESTNVYFLKAIIRGAKDYIKREQVKVSAVPQIDGLSVHNFIEYAQNKPQLLKYIPEDRDWVHIDRHWICDVLFTLDQNGIQQMIDTAMQERKQKLESSRNLQIQMRPEFVQALERCLNFSHEKGKSVNLLKESSKRKRRREELEDVKEEEDKLKFDKQQYLIQNKRLRMEKQEMEQELSILRGIAEEYINAPPNINENIPHQQFNI